MAAASRIRHESFVSTVLGKTKAFTVVLPEGYRASGEKDWPVLFLFHGRGRNERSLTDDPVTRKALLATSFVTVLPDGDDGWYINSPILPKDRYADYVAELVAHCETHYSISRTPAFRALSGWSMGGYGCAMYAAKNSNEFRVLAPMIGLLDFPRKGLPPGQSYTVPVQRFGSDPHGWQSLNPMGHADKLQGMRILLVTGTSAFDRTMNENFSRQLKALSIPHRLMTLDGGHTFPLVREAVQVVCAFVDESFSAARKSR